MSARPEVRVGIIGYGVMGKAHSFGYRVAPLMRALTCTPRVQVISGRSAAAVERAAQAYGIPEWCTDWREVATRPDIDVVDVCTPPGTHAEIVEAAAQAGKAILCEKPLATSYAAGRQAVEAAARAGVLHAIGFNYRRLPAVSLMKQMIDEGAVGTVQRFRATWLTDEFSDPSVPFDWRFDRRMGGTTITDLGSHLVDLARWIVSDPEAALAQSATYVTERADPAGGPPIPVTVDDASSALVRFTNGAHGTFEMARNCVRHPCDLTVEVNGAEGSIAFDYARLNELWYGARRDDLRLYGLRRIRAEHVSHPYSAQWWPIGQGVGYGSSFVNQVGDLFERWPEGPWTPDLSDGLAAQAICEAMERSAATQRWVRVDEVTNG
jgi:predicted dehydrogenase